MVLGKSDYLGWWKNSSCSTGNVMQGKDNSGWNTGLAMCCVKDGRLKKSICISGKLS